ncbi:alpha/beta fold hydrolase [Corallococcus praedator]|uniref:Alpha/beta fold hydrolase n=1 Tax=Corallococcus praedator TaxID=2316724 RepID=A0ABX9QKE0_9BACT|nr:MULTISPECIES: alpha/beta fold hydrolase [Corallococcus]RKH28727.1 alpha/beta fold hydrolase [Corallococcus sp. CA031C]RKI08369.1 alpha/beta fold hydrolase [Corallococcus praedator]
MSKPITVAGDGAVRAPPPVISVSPVVLSAPGRGEELHVRVSAPATGSQLPIIVFAHGFGSSLDGYAPLANYWAAHGFVVIQPTFLDSRTLGLRPDDPRTPLIWKFRVEDMKRVLDQLDLIEGSVPGLAGRIDRSRIAAAGHSFGAQTTGMLLGARIIGPDGSVGEDLSDPRISVGVLLAAAGRGGEDLSPFAARHFPYMNPSFAEMAAPALVVAGDKDDSPLSVRGPDWLTDAYTLSPGPKWLVMLFGAEHMLGGISGYLVTETTDENPERVAAVQRLTWAYLRSALYPGDPAWPAACTELMEGPHPLGRVEGK